jgi:hypothetical protein
MRHALFPRLLCPKDSFFAMPEPARNLIGTGVFLRSKALRRGIEDELVYAPPVP